MGKVVLIYEGDNDKECKIIIRALEKNGIKFYKSWHLKRFEPWKDRFWLWITYPSCFSLIHLIFRRYFVFVRYNYYRKQGYFPRYPIPFGIKVLKRNKFKAVKILESLQLQQKIIFSYELKPAGNSELPPTAS